MGNLLRRVLAFVLGMVFSTVAGIGALLGGGYWAYKNVKPVAIVTDDENLGELRDQSVEELLGLVLSALEDPDQYTFARLEAEYGLDLQSMLEGMGVTDVDTNGKNWAALMGISLFNLSEGIEPMLDSIKVRALYNFIPALMDKELDQVLSREAQEKLGDYSIMELVKSDELTGEMGLLKALKTLKLGALLPEYFNAEYDQAKHEYTYTLNEENEQAASLPVLGLFGNVSLGVIQGMMNGNDIMTELLEGGLSTVAETPIEEILYAVVATFAPELSETVKERAKALNGATIADLFVPNAEGGYDFYYTGVLSSIEVGYLLGYTDEDGDGVWLDKEGNPVEDLMQVVSNINLGKVIEEEDTFKLIDGLIGDVSLGMILNICGIEEGKIPQLDAFRGIEVGKLLEGQEGEFNGEVFFKALMNTLSESFGDVTLGEMIGMEETGNVILDSLFELKLADLMLEEYTVENIVEAFRNALGDVSIGLIMGYEKDENGAWICDDEVLSLLLDFSFNNIFDVISSDFTPSQIVEALLPDLCIGDLLCAFLDFERDEASSLYYYTAKTGRVTYLTEGASEFLDLKINDVVTALTDENAPEDMYAVLDAFKIGDAASITQAVVGKSLPITQENGKFVWGGDATSETSRVLNISAANVLADILNGGEKMLHKVDIDTYIDCVSKIAQEFASRTDLGKIFSAITIKNALEIAKECIDGPIANLTIDENYEIVEIIVRAAMIAVEVIYPAESRPEWVDTAAAIVDDHLDRGTFKDFPENFINKTPDGLINAIHAVVEDLLGEKYGDMVDAAADLLHRVIAGESLTQITVDTTQSIGALLADVEVIVDTFVSNEKVGDVVGALADLFANVTMDNFVEDILALNDELITAAADIVKAVFPEYAELADAVAQLLFDVAAGSLGAPGYENNLTVDVLFNDLQAVLGSVLDYEIIDKICDGMERIYEGVLVTDFIDATFNKGPELVYAVFALAEELFPEHEVLFDAIEKLVRDVTKGTISNPGIEADITIDVLVTDVHAILDYFLDVELLDKICRNIADMYEGVKVVDIVDATMNMGGELLTAAVKFIKYVLPEQAGLIEDIEKLVRDVFSGSINNIVIGKDLTVDLLVDDIQQVINNFTDHELVGKICNNLENLYEGVLVENFVDATMNMGGELLTVAVKFVKYIVPEQAGLIEDVEKLVRDVFSGSINNIVIGKDL
ncbi:MAG: hypothetical protein IJW13_04885, partial [Clostridia bacterium]|nr:hypothetical protein [Clostridia bacterium]